jgi:hypothetical protein
MAQSRIFAPANFMASQAQTSIFHAAEKKMDGHASLAMTKNRLWSNAHDPP